MRHRRQEGRGKNAPQAPWGEVGGAGPSESRHRRRRHPAKPLALVWVPSMSSPFAAPTPSGMGFLSGDRGTRIQRDLLTAQPLLSFYSHKTDTTCAYL